MNSQYNENINKKILKINKKIKKFNYAASFFALLGISLLIVFLIYLYKSKNKELDFIVNLGTLSGGIITSLFSLGGLIFVYVAFLGQEKQFLYQQIINNKSKVQDFENIFFKLLSYYHDNKKSEINMFEKFNKQFRTNNKDIRVLQEDENAKSSYVNTKSLLNFDISFMLQINSILKFIYVHDTDLIDKALYIEIFTTTLSIQEKNCIFKIFTYDDQLSKEIKNNIIKSEILKGITKNDIFK